MQSSAMNTRMISVKHTWVKLINLLTRNFLIWYVGGRIGTHVSKLKQGGGGGNDLFDGSIAVNDKFRKEIQQKELID